MNAVMTRSGPPIRAAYSCLCGAPLVLSTALARNFLSGCRGSNSGCMTPSHAYYHYTTARPFEVLIRAAGNRTQSTRTRSVCTTGILRPVLILLLIFYERFAVQVANTEFVDSACVLLGAIAFMPRKSVLRKTGVQSPHNSISVRFCNYGSDGNGKRERVAVYYALLSHLELWYLKSAIY